MLRAKNIEEATKQAQDAGIVRIKETARKTEEIIDSNNAKKEAAAGVDTPEPSAGASNLPPTGNPEEVSAPVKQAVNVMDLFRARQEKELEEEKEREARRIKMQQLGTGFAGLAASIGDMVRASEGAPVNPRDWQRIYDNLTAQEKANVNNYKVRMDKLREDARADRMAAAQAAAKAEAAKQQREYEAKKWRIELDEKLSEADRKKLLDWLIANLNAESREKSANIRANASKGKGRGSVSMTNIPVFGESIAIPKAARDDAANAAAGYIKSTGGSLGVLNDVLGAERQQAVVVRIGMILGQKGEKLPTGKYKYTLDPTYNQEGRKIADSTEITLSEDDIKNIKRIYKDAAALGGQSYSYEYDNSGGDDRETIEGF